MATELITELMNIGYNQLVKNFLLVGLFIFSILYIFYIHKNQEKTKYLLMGMVRMVLYTVSYVYSFLFFLLYPFMIHWEVSADTLLIWLLSAYGIIFTTFTTIFVLNWSLFITRFVIKGGNLDMQTEDFDWLKNFKRSFKR